MVEQVKEITLGDAFGEVAVSVNGVRVVIHADGSVESQQAAKTTPRVGGLVGDKGIFIGERELEDCDDKVPPRIGDPMPDGTKYAGISPDTGKPFYAARTDAQLTMKWQDAMAYAVRLEVQGHNDWRLPTRRELNLLFKSRGAIGGFNESGSGPAGWYWSCTDDLGDRADAWDQLFRSGTVYCHPKASHSSVRLVRG